MKVEDVLGVTDGTNGGLGCGKMKKVFFFVFFLSALIFPITERQGHQLIVRSGEGPVKFERGALV